MKPSSGEMIRRALEVERTKLAAEERERIIRLLRTLKLGYRLTGDVKAFQIIKEAIEMIGRES